MYIVITRGITKNKSKKQIYEGVTKLKQNFKIFSAKRKQQRKNTRKAAVK